MKKIYSIVIASLLTTIVFAQAPQKMSYQAVIRDANSNLVSNHTIGMKISILQGTANGTAVYTETQTPSANSNGLVSIEFGGSTGFSTIDWASDTYFIKIETDPNGGTNYTISATSQLLSVPYALYAKQAGNGFSGNYTDLSNKPTLFDGKYSSLTQTPTLSLVATTGNFSDLTNKPTLSTVATSGSFNDLKDKNNIARKSYVDSLFAQQPPIVDFGFGYTNGIISATNGSTNIPLGSSLLWYLDGLFIENSNSFIKSIIDGLHTISLTITTPNGMSYSKFKQVQVTNGVVVP